MNINAHKFLGSKVTTKRSMRKILSQSSNLIIKATMSALVTKLEESSSLKHVILKKKKKNMNITQK